MTTKPPAPTKVLDALLKTLERAAVFNANVQVRPAAILWPDQAEQWRPLIPVLRELLPQLLTLGDYDVESRTGPATWLKCMLARTLPDATWAAGVVPIFYLPGVGRLDLRAIETCPKPLQPLAELQYRGVVWTQENGRDWTVLAFLKTNNGSGLGLDVAQDAKTQAAIARALVPLADTPVIDLQGRRLDAADFDRLLSADPVRDILRWLDNPELKRQQWSTDVWEAFRSICRSDYDFDPETDGDIVGGEKLGRRIDKWEAVWARFAESPRLYSNLPSLLRKAEPSNQQSLFEDRSTWPGANEDDEVRLRASLGELEGTASHDAIRSLKELDAKHGPRRDWVWAGLGMSPLARALGHLAVLADITSEAVGGLSAKDMGALYQARAWRADAAVWRALACVERIEDVAVTTAAIRAVYLPWIEVTAERLQNFVERDGFPVRGEAAWNPITPVEGECLLFADGLRFDVGQALREALEAQGMLVSVSAIWQGLPSVTATCKAAASPIADLVIGKEGDGDFLPSVAETGEPLTANRFRKLIEGIGIQLIGGEETGDPKAKGWCEYGDLDHAGHQEGARLARRIGEQVRALRERVTALLDAGWKQVRVVTDHGWLLMPGGLPKTDLPAYLAETRWGRCAILKHSAAPTPLVVPWRWSADISVALPPGVSSYKANTEYTHGGLSLQECLTPQLVVTRTSERTAEVSIREISWMRRRCRVEVTGAAFGMSVDLRTKAALAASTLAQGGKPLDGDGKASLVVQDDSAEGMAALVVVINADGAVVSKATTTVGGED